MPSPRQIWLLGQLALLCSLTLVSWYGYGAWEKYKNGYIPEATVERQMTTPVRPAIPKYRQQEVIAAHLFGRKQQQKAQPKVVQAPKTRLKLKLYGLIGSEDSEYARAIIGVGNKKLIRSYAIGEAIQDTDAELHRVESAQVFIDRSGNIESLPLERSPSRRGGQENQTAQLLQQSFQNQNNANNQQIRNILNPTAVNNGNTNNVPEVIPPTE